MPLTKPQSHALRVLAAERSPDGYIAGGIVINREGPRFSGDIDIFQDTEQRLEAAAQADAKALTDAGLKFAWKKIVTGKSDAEGASSAVFRAMRLALFFWREEKPFSPILTPLRNTSAMPERRAVCGRHRRRYQAPCWNVTKNRMGPATSRNLKAPHVSKTVDAVEKLPHWQRSQVFTC